MGDEIARTESEQSDTIHTDAELELKKKVDELSSEIGKLREENRKLFLRLGGDGGEHREKTPDDEMREMLRKFQQSGYDPSTLYGGN